MQTPTTESALYPRRAGAQGAHVHDADCGCGTDWAAARRAAQRILKSAYRVDLRKALNPLKDDDFLLIVQQLSDDLHSIAGPVEKTAVEAALAALDLDFAKLTGSELAQATRAANLALRDIPKKVLPKLTGTINQSLSTTVKGTKVSAAAAHNWAISTSFDAVDQKMVDVLSNLGTFITDRWGNRATTITNGMTAAIERGVAQGLRNEDIARDLQRLAAKTTDPRTSLRYWNLVATNASNRARGFGHLRSMESAGVQNYIFTAILDERTSLQCRALHGTVFPVSTGLKAYQDLEVASQGYVGQTEQVMPFIATRSLGGGNTEMFVQPPGTSRTVIGQAIGSAVGRADVRGRFTNMLNPGQLASAGITVPPIHHACRSTILPDLSSTAPLPPMPVPSPAAIATPTRAAPKPKPTPTRAKQPTPTRAKPKPKPRELTYQEWISEMSEETMEVFELWSEEGYQWMREADAARSLGEAPTGRIGEMYRSMSRAPKYEGALYRGMSNLDRSTVLKTMKSGATIEMDALSSWSAKESVAKEFSEGALTTMTTPTRERPWVRFRVRKMPKSAGAVDIAELSYYEHQAEVVVPKGTKFRVVKRTASGSNGFIVDLEAVPPKAGV